MLAKPSRATKWAFGPFEFDAASGELHKHGYKVKLSSQPSQVLSALVDRPGDLVTREDLRNRLWPGATVGDFEHGLNAAVNKLRQALGDAANQPRYVETLAGLGYRFVAPVHPVGTAVLELVPAPATWQPAPQGFPPWAAAVAVLLAFLAGASLMTLHRSPGPPMKAT